MFQSALLLKGVAAAVAALAPQAADPIAWRSDLRQAETEAAQSRRPLLVVFR